MQPLKGITIEDTEGTEENDSQTANEPALASSLEDFPLCALCPLWSNGSSPHMPQATAATTVAEALAHATTQNGTTLAALSDERPLLLVLLRQFG